jgi:anti-sigma regulatory factor (Ser/Thr protein kinase)
MTPDPRPQPRTPDRQPGATAAGPAQPGIPDADGYVVLDQPFDSGSLYALRAAVAAHALQAGVPDSRAGDIVLAVHELAVNAIRHGAGHGRLVVSKRDSALHCQVTDDGAPSPAREPAATGTQPAPVDEVLWPSQHGHGLWLIRQVADQVSVRSGPGGTVATASFTLP